MPNKYYLITSIAIIFFIGSFAIFNAGYEESAKEDIQEKEEEKQTVIGPSKDSSKEEATEEEKIKEYFPETVECSYEIEGIPSPKAVRFNPEGDEFWVASLMNKKYGIFVFDSKSGEEKNKIPLPDGGGVEIIFDSKGNNAFVSQMEMGRVFKIDTSTKEIIETYNSGGNWTKGIDLSYDEKYIFVSNWTDHNVSKINLSKEKGKEMFSTVETPRGIYLTKEHLYVAGFAEGEIEKIDLKTKEAKIVKKTGGAMRSIVSDGKYLYVSDMANQAVYRVNKSSEEVIKFAETDKNPNTIRLILEKKVLVVSNRGINHPSGDYSIAGPEWGSVLFFDLMDGNLIYGLVGGNQTTGLDISKDGKFVVFTNFLDGSLTFCLLPDFDNFSAWEEEEIKRHKEKIIK